MDSKVYILAAVILLLMIAAFVIHRRRRSSRAGFMPDDPATPKLRESVSLIKEQLDCVGRSAAQVQAAEEKVKSNYSSVGAGEDCATALRLLERAAVMSSVAARGVAPMAARIDTATPTYANALGAYHSLRDGDQAIWSSAEALDGAGGRLQELASRIEGCADASGTQVGALRTELMSAGSNLRIMAVCLLNLVRGVHQLGVALRLE